jgi:hypothetical protein
MTQFKWTKKTDAEIAAMEKLPPEGDYKGFVTEAVAGIGQSSGQPNIKLTIKFKEDNSPTWWKVNDWFTDSDTPFMKRKIKKFFESSGRPELFEKEIMNQEEFLDLTPIFTIKHEANKDDLTKKRLVISNYVLPGKEKTTKLKIVDDFTDDDIKF